MKTTKRLVSLVLAFLLSVSPVWRVHAEEAATPTEYDQLISTSELLASDDFSDPNTTLAVVGKNFYEVIYWHTDEITNNTYMKMAAPAVGGILNFYHYSEASLERVVFECDIRWDNPGLRVAFLERKSQKTIMSLQNGTLSFNGSNAAATVNSGEWHTLTYVMDFINNTFDVFLDEILVVDGSALPTGIDSSMTGIRLYVNELSTAGGLNTDESSNKDLLIDNVKFYKQAEVVVTPYEQLLASCDLAASDDFSNSNNTLATVASNYTGVIYTETDTNTNNTYLKFFNAGTGARVNLAHGLSNAEFIVFEAEICWNNPGLRVVFYSRGDNKALMIAQNGVLTFNSPDGNTTRSIVAGQWYKVSYALNFAEGVYDAYVGEELVVDSAAIPNGVNELTAIRLQIADLKNSTDTGDNKDFLLDNLKWYLLSDSVDSDTAVTITPSGDGVFTKGSDVLAWVAEEDNLTAISPYEGKYFVNGEKKESAHEFICRGDEYLVPIDVFEQVFGVTAEASIDGVTVGQVTFTFDEQKIHIAGNNYEITDAACVINGVAYVPFFAYAKYATNKYVSESEYGDVILTDSELTFTEEERFEVDLFLTKTRPTATEIQSAYNTMGNANTHPRIWKDAEGFAELRALVESDEQAGAWWSALKVEADALVTSGVISPGADSYNFSTNTVHELQLEAIRQLCNETQLLGLAYNMTGDVAYAELLKTKFMYVIDNNPSWYDGDTIHYLRHGQLAEAMGIGYDWIYNYLTEEERTKVAEWSYYDVLIPIREAYYAGTTGDYWWTTTKLNWNTVISGGAIVLALSLADEYPETAFDAIEKALRSGEYSLSTWAPDGGWYEGNSYAAYTAKYMQYELSALSSVLGTMYNREKSRGLQDASFYMYYIDSLSGGSVNFGDSDTSHAKVLGFYWADLYNSKEMACLLEKWHNLLGTEFGTIQDFLYYKPELMEDIESLELELDKFFAGDRSQMVVTREGWENADQMFASWAGGRVDQSHDHADAGSFVYDINGYRFICDLGAKNYTYSGNQWDYFRKRAESHNVMVINPDESSVPGVLGLNQPGQDLDGHAKLLYLNSGTGGVVSAIDLADMYKGQTTSYIRGFMTLDNRRSLVVRDEIVLKQENSKLYWNLMTAGTINVLDNNTVIITCDDEAIIIEFITNASSISAYRTDAIPYEFSPQPTDGETNDGMFSRLVVEMVASGEFYIAAKITPMGEGISSAVPSERIAEWAPQDIHEKDQVDTSTNVVTSITADGREIFENGVRTYELLLIGEDAPLPVINAIAVPGKTVEIINASNHNEATIIVVSDPSNPGYSENYVIRYNVLPDYEDIEEYPRYSIVNFEVSEEPDSRYPGVAICDGDMGTKWTPDNLGAWAVQEMSTVQKIYAFGLAFDYSNKRAYTFEILVSDDGVNYESVLIKTTELTSASGQMVVYVLDEPVNAKYVKFVSGGSTSNTKSNVKELAILGPKACVGGCADADTDHVCDYGCDQVYGTCEDADKDHACDYGCDQVYGTCEDADNDHVCDYGCGNTFIDGSDS